MYCNIYAFGLMQSIGPNGTSSTDPEDENSKISP